MSRHPTSPFQDAAAGPATEVVTAPAPDPLLAGPERPLAVLVTGGTGFVGAHLAGRLVSRGHRVRALSRRRGDRPLPPDVEWRAGDVTRPDSLRGAADGCDAVVHLAGIARERGPQTFGAVHVAGVRHVLSEAARAGAERIVLVSAVGAREEGSPFFRTKFAGERAVRASGLEHVIFRPSIIYGPGDRFTTELASLLRRLPVFPIPGVGSLRLQPVSVEDVADALVQAVERPDTVGAVYELGGPERLKFRKIVGIVAAVLGLRRPIVHLPGPLAGVAFWLIGRLGLPAPVTPEQLDMFREASLFTRADNPLRTVFRLEPLPFRAAVADYL